MARIPLPVPETMNAAQRKVYDAIIGGPRARLVGPLRAALHNPELADRWQKMGALLRFGTSIPARLSELAILVTARHWNSQLEWFIHAEAARVAGLSTSLISTIEVGAVPTFDDPDEAAVYEFTRQLLQSGTVDDQVYDEVLASWQAVGTVELAAIVGYYSMVAMTLNVHQIPLPEEAVPPLAPVPQAEAPARGIQLTSLPPACRRADVAAGEVE